MFGCSGIAYFDLEGDVVKDVLVDIVGGVAGEDGEAELAESALGDVRKGFFELL